MNQLKLQWPYSIFITGLLLFLMNGCSPEDPVEPGTFTDAEGNVYHIVMICDQVWMIENLKVTKYRNGDAIPKVTGDADWGSLTTAAYCYSKNDSTTYSATYGKLYNGYAVSDPRGLAPEGWHIPTDDEWTTLSICLGGDDVAGGSMKESGTMHWVSPNNGATNLSGFTGLPGGSRQDFGIFDNDGSHGNWWSSTEDDTGGNWYRTLGYFDDNLYRNNYGVNRKGFSVRCIKD